MKKRAFLTLLTSILAMSISACGPSENKNTTQTSGKSPIPSKSVSSGPVKTVKNLSISLRNDNNKAYIRVTGTQENYAEGEFTWAWGIADQAGTFADGKASPEASDFKPVTFNASGAFTVNYCLTDITTIKAGTLYRIYGGTPETYDDIPFESNQFGARDATRNYYLRQDQNNSLVFDNIQPITYTKASVVNVAASDLPTGVTAAGAYVKFGGTNSKNLTMESINAWHEAGNIAGNFQRVIGDYMIHEHVDEERFWKIEGNEVYFYLYVGFIKEGEGWMAHFDVVSGNDQAGLSMGTTIDGASYDISGVTYKVYADSNKSGEENYWGCLGVFRPAAQA